MPKVASRRHVLVRAVLLMSAVSLGGCYVSHEVPGLDGGGPPPMDSGPRDTGPRDTGPRDTGPRDSGPRDTGPRDSGSIDAGPPGTVIELGDHTLTPRRPSVDVRFVAPPDVLSVTLIAELLSGPSQPLLFASVREPSGAEILNIDEILSYRDTPLRWLPVRPYQNIAALIPNSTPDRLSVMPGGYQATIAYSPDLGAEIRVRVRAVIRTGSVPRTSLLRLRVHLATPELSARTAAADPNVERAFAAMGRALIPHGIFLDAVDFVEVTGPARERYSMLTVSTGGADDELSQMLRLADGGPRVLDVFFVQLITIEGLGVGPVGIAGGLPGSIDDGTVNSGVAIAYDTLVGIGRDGPEILGQTLAHESGHFLGLFHTTESRPPCRPGEDPSGGTCAPFGGGDVLADTALNDETNLMHWTIVEEVPEPQLSEGQAFVILRHPFFAP